MAEAKPPERIDGRKVGLSTQGYPLRKIMLRENGIHILSCGHRLPKPAEATDYDLRKSRRCVECGPQQKQNTPLGYVPESRLREKLERHKRFYCYWLLRAYQSGHREGWEDGPSTQETMTNLLHVLANSGFDPSLDDAKELLKAKPAYWCANQIEEQE